jgi:two-component system, NarL family, nitrate/nitrite response regulator NarL
MSPRQRQVLAYIADGLTNAQIGFLLHIQEETVKTHVRRILYVLGARNRAQAVAVGMRNGVIG